MLNINFISQNDDRRHQPPNNQSMWYELNAAQKVAVSSLFKHGFEISLVRLNQNENIVGMLLYGKPATINVDGKIDTVPDISIRNEIIKAHY